MRSGHGHWNAQSCTLERESHLSGTWCWAVTPIIGRELGFTRPIELLPSALERRLGTSDGAQIVENPGLAGGTLPVWAPG